MSNVYEIEFRSYEQSIPEIMDSAGAEKILSTQTAVLIKPNLINDAPYPITTPAPCCKAIIDYIRNCSDAEIVIAEGCGCSSLETCQVFDRLGYSEMSNQSDIQLIDLNHAPLRHLTKPECSVFPEMYLPEILFTHYVISVPVLKAHSLADITGTMKNMIGAAPPKHYSGMHGSWKKSAFHGNMHQAIVELNRYRAPDFSIMDATTGMAEFHLGGAHCDPPVNRLLAGFDPQEIDRRAAELLGLNWKNIPHLTI